MWRSTGSRTTRRTPAAYNTTVSRAFPVSSIVSYVLRQGITPEELVARLTRRRRTGDDYPAAHALEQAARRGLPADMVEQAVRAPDRVVASSVEGRYVKVRYDPETDSPCILLRDAPVEESDEVNPGLIVDYDTSGSPVAVEILSASRLFGEKVLTVEVELVPTVSRSR